MSRPNRVTVGSAGLPSATPDADSQVMELRRLRPSLVLAVWTLVVWTSRIRNIWDDDELTTSGQVWRTALALAFTGFAAVVLAAYLRARRSGAWTWTPRLVRAFAAWTVGVWAIRAVQIGIADHGAGFKAVHTALAVVSAGLALWADRQARGVTRETGPRPARV